MHIFKDMPIISCRNRNSLGFVNSDIGKVVKYDNENVEIEIDGIDENIIIDIEAFGKCFYPAYCITIHKSQGCTIRQPFTIHEWDKLDTKLKYVALSRATTIKHINIL